MINAAVFAGITLACWVFNPVWTKEHWDIVVAIDFGCAGVVASFLVDLNLERISEHQRGAAEFLDKINHAEKRLQEQITNLEDATRRTLTGFGEIFARALWLLEQAQQDIWYVNFLFAFGVPHTTNQAICKDYAFAAKSLKLSEPNFDHAVARFRALLHDKVETVDKIFAVTLNPEALRHVLERLKAAPGPSDDLDEPTRERLQHKAAAYAKLDPAQVAETEAQVCKSMCLKWRFRPERKVNLKDCQVFHRDKIPYQLLIAKIPPRTSGAESRYGCLVFLVGTENLKTSSEPKGFYTELPNVVELYKDLALNLMQDEAAVRLDDETLQTCWNSKQTSVSQEVGKA
jgi:hypothetical protein